MSVVICRIPLLLADGWDAKHSNNTWAKVLSAWAKGLVCKCGWAAAEALRRADREPGSVFLFAFNIIGRLKYKNPVCFFCLPVLIGLTSCPAGLSQTHTTFTWCRENSTSFANIVWTVERTLWNICRHFFPQTKTKTGHFAKFLLGRSSLTHLLFPRPTGHL